MPESLPLVCTPFISFKTIVLLILVLYLFIFRLGDAKGKGLPEKDVYKSDNPSL